MTEATAKKFNWKKAITIFFGVVIVLRVLMYLFGGGSDTITQIPKCDSSFSKRLITKIMKDNLENAGEYDTSISFDDTVEVLAGDSSRICKTEVTVSNSEGESFTGIKTFHVFKSKTKNEFHIRLEPGHE